MHLNLLSGVSIALTLASSVVAHANLWHYAMFGFNYTGPDKQEDPLQERVFSGDNGWWMHGAHINMPPNPGEYMELPAGQSTFFEITCDKGASSYYTSNPGGDIRDGNKVCPGSNSLEFHATGIDDTKGCALSIAYKPVSQIKDLQPEDLVVFSVNHTCVWERFTKFEIPADMPACPEGGCTCAWHWIHSADAGAEQMYMNGYACTVTGAKSSAPLAKPQVARRCGADNDKELVKPAAPQNCTYGAKQPLYWLQKERNNMFEGNHAPPFYNDLYGFSDGAQNDIFVSSKLPAMNWEGAPTTGALAAVPGVFPGGSTPASNSPPSDSDPSPSSSPSPSPSPSSSSTPKAVAPNASASDASPSPSTTPSASSPKPTTKSSPSSGTGSGTANVGSNPKKCKSKSAKKSEKKMKRSFIDNLVSHRRQHSRRHTKH